ncbi:uncharacterized protein [Triticum aestivum]|uniref:uncharacterized protein n=1 Tax=Triticum aestivum TaxID=4565 RepID=UPI001D02319D|nr:uncharacterized protein LOC123112505 [Triticum aestivum]
MDDARRGVCGAGGFCRTLRWSSRGREGKKAGWVRCAPGPPSSSTSSKSARSPRALAVARRSSPLVRGCADALGIEGALLPRGWRRSGSSEWARGSGPLVVACLAIARDAGLADSISSTQGPVLVSACPIAHDFSDPARSEGAAAASLAAALSRIATPISSDLNTSPTSPVAIIPCLTRKKSNAYTPVFSLSNYTVPTSHGDIHLQLFGQGRGGVDHGCTEVHPLAACHRGCNEDSLTKPHRRSGSPMSFLLHDFLVDYISLRPESSSMVIQH